MRPANHDGGPKRRRLEDESRILDWNANAAVTRWSVRNDRKGVDCQAAVEVEGVAQPDVKLARPALPHALDHNEASLRRRRERPHSKRGSRVEVRPFNDQ